MMRLHQTSLGKTQKQNQFSHNKGSSFVPVSEDGCKKKLFKMVRNVFATVVPGPFTTRRRRKWKHSDFPRKCRAQTRYTVDVWNLSGAGISGIRTRATLAADHQLCEGWLISKEPKGGGGGVWIIWAYPMNSLAKTNCLWKWQHVVRQEVTKTPNDHALSSKSNLEMRQETNATNCGWDALSGSGRCGLESQPAGRPAWPPPCCPASYHSDMHSIEGVWQIAISKPMNLISGVRENNTNFIKKNTS